MLLKRWVLLFWGAAFALIIDHMVICRLTLLLGPPSSGKTTLLLALAGKLDQNLRVCSCLSKLRGFCYLYHSLIYLWMIFRTEIWENHLLWSWTARVYSSENLCLYKSIWCSPWRNDSKRDIWFLWTLFRCGHKVPHAGGAFKTRERLRS